jgi:hypothetical protein
MDVLVIMFDGITETSDIATQARYGLGDKLRFPAPQPSPLASERSAAGEQCSDGSCRTYRSPKQSVRSSQGIIKSDTRSAVAGDDVHAFECLPAAQHAYHAGNLVRM